MNKRRVLLKDSEDSSDILTCITEFSDKEIIDICLDENLDETCFNYEEKLEFVAHEKNVFFERIYVDEVIYV